MFSKPSLPSPTGPFQVGYQDIMTSGTSSTSSYFRILYPAPSYTTITNPPVWADMKIQTGLVNFIVSMFNHWPTWVNNSEFKLFPLFRKFLSGGFFNFISNLVFTALGRNNTIPISKSAPLAPKLANNDGWPVVVFSGGMGCNRFTMSHLCYQLASMGVVVVSIEHRDGSGWGTYFNTGDGIEHIPHKKVSVNAQEYETRKEQLDHRHGEVIRAIDLLQRINAGDKVCNVADDKIMTDLEFLKSSMDLEGNFFLMGHSFGGATALLASSDPRIKAVLALDPWMFPLSKQHFKISKPALIINTEAFVNQNNIEVIEKASKYNPDVKIKVQEGGVHLSATDIPYLFAQNLLKKGLGFMAKQNPEEVMANTNKMVWDWLKIYIK